MYGIKNVELIQAQANREILEITKNEIKYSKKYETEIREITIKNTSNQVLDSVKFAFGYEEYTLYDVLPNESYKIESFNIDNEEDLEILSVNEVEENNIASVEVNYENSKITGEITNNGDISIYPNQIIFYVKDAQGDITQRTCEYSGCFFEDLVISAGNKFKFELELDDGDTVLKEKGMVFKYSDLDFEDYEIQKFKEM